MATDITIFSSEFVSPESLVITQERVSTEDYRKSYGLHENFSSRINPRIYSHLKDLLEARASIFTEEAVRRIKYLNIIFPPSGAMASQMSLLGIEKFPSLEHVGLQSTGFQTWPRFESCPNLKSIIISNQRNIDNILGIGPSTALIKSFIPQKLQKLTIMNCPKISLEAFWNFNRLTAQRALHTELVFGAHPSQAKSYPISVIYKDNKYQVSYQPDPLNKAIYFCREGEREPAELSEKEVLPAVRQWIFKCGFSYKVNTAEFDGNVSTVVQPSPVPAENSSWQQMSNAQKKALIAAEEENTIGVAENSTKDETLDFADEKRKAALLKYIGGNKDVSLQQKYFFYVGRGIAASIALWFTSIGLTKVGRHAEVKPSSHAFHQTTLFPALDKTHNPILKDGISLASTDLNNPEPPIATMTSKSTSALAVNIQNPLRDNHANKAARLSDRTERHRKLFDILRAGESSKTDNPLSNARGQ